MNDLQHSTNNEEEIRIKNIGASKKNLEKRAKRKFFIIGLMRRLIEFNKNVLQNLEWCEIYAKTYKCSDILEGAADKYSSEFCKKKICPICNSIKTMQNIFKYKDALDQLPDKQLLTLTIPNVSARDLEKTIKEMIYNFQKIKDNLRKPKKGKSYIIKGTRNLEITFNPKYINPVKYFGKKYGSQLVEKQQTGKCYHPHFHCIISGLAEAEAVKKEWLKLYPDAQADFQDIRELGNDIKDLIECFKYSLKVVADKKDAYYNTKRIEIMNEEGELETLVGNFTVTLNEVYIEAVDIINKAVSTIGDTGKIRTFQTFGIVGKKDDDKPKEETEEKKQFEDFVKDYFEYNIEKRTWISVTTNKPIVDVIISSKMEMFQKDEKYVTSYTFDGDFDKFDKEVEKQKDKLLNLNEQERQKEKLRFKRKMYLAQIAYFKNKLFSEPYDFNEDNVNQFYLKVCEGEGLKPKKITIVEKLKDENGRYNFSTNEIKILKNKKVWRYVLLHEIAHYYLDKKLNFGVHKHNEIFKTHELRLLKKYLINKENKITNKN